MVNASLAVGFASLGLLSHFEVFTTLAVPTFMNGEVFSYIFNIFAIQSGLLAYRSRLTQTYCQHHFEAGEFGQARP